MKKKQFNPDERKRIKDLDEATRLAAFRENLSDSIKRDLEKGLDAEQLMSKYESMAVARLITILQTEPDSGKALGAVKELLDRIQGKPTQKQEVKHQYEKLQDDELDAVLNTMLDEDKD
jgi:hypothetical protein